MSRFAKFRRSLSRFGEWLRSLSGSGKFWRYFRYSLLSVALLAAGFTLYLDIRVRSEFEGRRFALPARIYARPLELHAGLRVPQADVVAELRSLGYREVSYGEYGWFLQSDNRLEITLRARP